MLALVSFGAVYAGESQELVVATVKMGLWALLSNSQKHCAFCNWICPELSAQYRLTSTDLNRIVQLAPRGTGAEKAPSAVVVEAGIEVDTEAALSKYLCKTTAGTLTDGNHEPPVVSGTGDDRENQTSVSRDSKLSQEIFVGLYGASSRSDHDWGARWNDGHARAIPRETGEGERVSGRVPGGIDGKNSRVSHIFDSGSGKYVGDRCSSRGAVGNDNRPGRCHVILAPLYRCTAAWCRSSGKLSALCRRPGTRTWCKCSRLSCSLRWGVRQTRLQHPWRVVGHETCEPG